jgi:hypothetical protein
MPPRWLREHVRGSGKCPSRGLFVGPVEIEQPGWLWLGWLWLSAAKAQRCARWGVAYAPTQPPARLRSDPATPPTAARDVTCGRPPGSNARSSLICRRWAACWRRFRSAWLQPRRMAWLASRMRLGDGVMSNVSMIGPTSLQLFGSPPSCRTSIENGMPRAIGALAASPLAACRVERQGAQFSRICGDAQRRNPPTNARSRGT